MLLECLHMSTHTDQPARDCGLEESFRLYPVSHLASVYQQAEMPPCASYHGTSLSLNPVRVGLTLPISKADLRLVQA